MYYLFLISGENPELAKAEIQLFAGARIREHLGFSVVAECESPENNRLAYTRALCRFLFSCRIDELDSRLKSFEWQKVYRESFCIHTHHAAPEKAREIADIIWDNLKNPKVDLKNAKTQIDFSFENGKVFCGLRIYENKERFGERKAHKRPGFSPISLHPKLARALVNMTGIKKGQTLLDPFCGTGGILLEAGLMKLKCIGSDIDEDMIEKAKANLGAFKIRDYKLMKADARKIKVKCDAIATDPPYGKASSLRKESIKKLYSDFLANAYKILKKKSRVAIIMPNLPSKGKGELERKRQIRLSVKSKFKTIKRIDVYIHKSLTRTITILEK